jgi:hypothetical protein
VRPFTTTEAKIIREWTGTLPELGRRLDRTAKSISQFRVRSGIARKRQNVSAEMRRDIIAAAKRGDSHKRIATRMNLCLETVGIVTKNAGLHRRKKYSEAELQIVAEWTGTLRGLAEKIGRSVPAIKYIRRTVKKGTTNV